MTQHAVTMPAAAARSTRLGTALGLFVLGAAVVFIAGFAQPHALHEATHDTRHSLALPCH